MMNQNTAPLVLSDKIGTDRKPTAFFVSNSISNNLKANILKEIQILTNEMPHKINLDYSGVAYKFTTVKNMRTNNFQQPNYPVHSSDLKARP